jgi:hypothetical protein
MIQPAARVCQTGSWSDGGPAAKKNRAWQPLTMRPHRTGNSQQFFCYWELLPAFAALLTKGWPRVDAFVFRTSVGLSLFI